VYRLRHSRGDCSFQVVVKPYAVHSEGCLDEFDDCMPAVDLEHLMQIMNSEKTE
jgi:hypothetical protein